MLLKQKLSLYRVLRITWRVDILMAGLCFAAYLVDEKVLSGIHILPAVPTLIGTAIAFFIGFNNNQAYSRWWEARTVWGGLVNDSRSWSRELLAHGGDPGKVRKMILRHIGFLYALKANLRQDQDAAFTKYMDATEVQEMMETRHIPHSILRLQSADLERLSLDQTIDGFRFQSLNNLLRNFTDAIGRSERIHKTVFPTTYVYFTKLFIWLMVILMTMTLTESIGMWAVLFGWVGGFVFHTAHINGMNLMNPFELTPYGVPLNAITRTIEINLLQDLGEKDIPAPEPAQRNGEYIL